jgi:hypothetical protein
MTLANSAADGGCTWYGGICAGPWLIQLVMVAVPSREASMAGPWLIHLVMAAVPGREVSVAEPWLIQLVMIAGYLVGRYLWQVPGYFSW